MATAKGLRSLSRLRGRVGVGVPPRVALLEWRESFPHPPRSPSAKAEASLRRSYQERPPKAAYAPPQAGEVKVPKPTLPRLLNRPAKRPVTLFLPRKRR